ncbi:MAG TPA: hybrid sensor histidine kinase/response regulator, partial [Planctomycetota bacterium]|nr:hybrid sensor histidine kinase/response regulator [Planctomycetota bacterium]
LDKLMNLAGELVLGRNRLTQVVRLLGERFGEDRLYQELISAVDGINFVSSDLQAAVLKTRMQPIGKIFSRFNRTVRDLAKQMDKEVVLILQGRN